MDITITLYRYSSLLVPYKSYLHKIWQKTTKNKSICYLSFDPESFQDVIY